MFKYVFRAEEIMIFYTHYLNTVLWETTWMDSPIQTLFLYKEDNLQICKCVSFGMHSFCG